MNGLQKVKAMFERQAQEAIDRAIATRAEQATEAAARQRTAGYSVPEALEAGLLVPFRLEDRRRDTAGEMAHYKLMGARPAKVVLPEVPIGVTPAVAELVAQIGGEAVANMLMGALEGAGCRRGYVENPQRYTARSPEIRFVVFEDLERRLGEHRLVAQPVLDGLVIYSEGEAPPVAPLGRGEVA